MLDLQPRVQLDEVERAVGADEELERAGVRVADRAHRALGSGLHLLARLGRQRRRRRLLDQLLVPALDRALALADREHAAVRVAEHLDLDVPRGVDHLLDVEVRIAERRLRLRRGGAERVLELLLRVDEPHALAAAAGRRLEQHRVAELVGGRARLRDRRTAFGARDERHAGGAQLVLRARLVAHALHHVGRRPDEDEVVVLARARERGVLGEEAPARDAPPRSRSSSRPRSSDGMLR